jgi:hypothetical protein
MDALMMVMFVVAFRIQLSPDESSVGDLAGLFSEAGTTAELLVYIEGNLNFPIFICATVGSLVTGHAMTACARYAHKLGEFSPQALAQSQGPKLRLCYMVQPEGKWRARLHAHGPFVAMTFSLALLAVGLWIDVFTFVTEGAGGYLLGDARFRSFSVVSLGMSVPSAMEPSNSPMSIFLLLIFLTFVAFAVVAYFVLLIVLWAAPLTPKLQSRLFVICQSLAAWSCIEVFVVTILASVLETPQLFAFLLGNKCDGINVLLPRLPFAKDLPGSPVCADLRTELCDGFYILLTAAVVSAITGRLVIARCKTALGMDS